jgi:tetratricopeptide (TPR) repeat protein
LPLSVRWGEVATPAGSLIGATPEGGVLLAEDRGRVALLDPALAPLRNFSSEDLREPAAAAVAPDGRVYIADRGAGEIRVFSPDGGELFTFGRGTRVLFFRGGDGRLIKPRHVAVSRGGIVAVTDVGKVELFGPDGAFMNALGAGAEDDGAMKRPIGAVFTSASTLVVADDKHSRIAEYDAAGRWTGRVVGGIAPLAIAADEEGRVYVLDEKGPSIRVFSRDLEPLASIGATGLDIGGLRNASTLVVARDRLFVSRRDGLARLDLDLPPPPPAGLRIEPLQRAARITWETIAVGYADRIEVAYEERGEDRRVVRRLEKNSIEVGDLLDETDYVFRLRLRNRLDLPGVFAEPITTRTPALELAPPDAPAVAFLPDLSAVRLSWRPSASPYVVEYIVEGRTDGEFAERARTAERSAVIRANGIRAWRIRPVAANGRAGAASRETVHAAAEGLAALAEGAHALAAARLQHAVGVESRTAPLHRALGEAGERLERFAEATTAYRAAIAIDPADTRSRLGLVRLALLRNETATVRAELDRVPSAPNDPEYLLVVGLAALAAEDYETAVRRLAEAVALAPTARHREALGRAEEARRQFGENRPRLEIVSAAIRPLFPVLYKAYMNEPIGEAVVRNAGRAPLDRIRFSIFIRGAMDFPSDTVIMRLLPGETTRVPIRAELSNAILFATEDDTKLAELRLTYYRAGDPIEIRQSVPFRLLARTALTWDEPRRVAAFVTTRAPSVAQFARNLLGMVRPNPEVNAPARTVLLVRAALAAHGLRYQPDPASPFQSGTTDRDRIDHVQLPEETLRNRAGDCDDLVILLAALLEHLGVRTAIADLPGHLLLFFDSELPIESARLIADDGMWIERHGTAWFPIETTLIDGLFDGAIRAGRKVFRDDGTFFVTSEAWNAFPPITSLESVGSTPAPDADAVRRRYGPEELRLRRRAAELLAALVEFEGEDGANARAAIMGRFGLIDEAEALLENAGESAASLNNRANLLLLRGDPTAARRLYEAAGALDPEDEGIRRNLERLP